MSHASIHPLLRMATAPDDRDAWTAIVTAYSALCWRIALRMLGDADRANDAVQDALLAIRASAHRFRPGEDVEGTAIAWVARVTVNTCHAHRRRRASAGMPAEELAAPAVEPADEESLAAVRAAIGELPANLRHAIELRYFADLDGSRLAEALGVNQGAARMRIHRGLDALHAILVRRGVCLSAVALVGVLDGWAADAVPPPPDSTAAWSRIALPSLDPTISIGAIIAMSITGSILAAGLAFAFTYSVPASESPPPAPKPVPVPAPAPAPAPKQTFATVESALIWLAGRQQTDGSWLPGMVAVPAVEREAASAIAMLAFFGAGHWANTPSRYQGTVQRGGAWLVTHPPKAEAPLRTLALHVMALSDGWNSMQPAGGWPGVPLQPESPAQMQDRLAWEAATESALQALLRRRVGPGWPATPAAHDIDVPATVWAVAALKSAFAAGRPSAGPALDQVRAWASRAWQQRQGPGFPATTQADGMPSGAAAADIPGLAMVGLLYTSRHVPDWADLIARATASPQPVDADGALLGRWGSFWAGGAAWNTCHAQRSSMAGLASSLASTGNGLDAATAILAMEVHARWDALSGLPAEADLPLDTVLAPAEAD